MVYPRLVHQRCWVHKMRNILAKVRKRESDAVKTAARRRPSNSGASVSAPSIGTENPQPGWVRMCLDGKGIPNVGVDALGGGVYSTCPGVPMEIPAKT